MRFVIVRDEKHIPVELEEREGGYLVTLDGVAHEVESARILEGLYSLLIGGESFEVTVHPPSPGLLRCPPLRRHAPRGAAEPAGNGPPVAARQGPGRKPSASRHPCRARWSRCSSRRDRTVSKGQGVVVVEAMKMQNELQALSDGVVKQIRVKEGDTVDSGAELITLGEDAEAP